MMLCTIHFLEDPTKQFYLMAPVVEAELEDPMPVCTCCLPRVMAYTCVECWTGRHGVQGQGTLMNGRVGGIDSRL